MIRRLSLMLASILMGVSLLVPAAVATAAATQTDAKNKVCEGIGGCSNTAGEKSVSDILALVVNVLSTIVAVAAVLVIVFAGFRYVIAMGDSSKISSAKDTIMYAIIGLIVAGLAQVIVRFVLSRF
jgi:hypothetical protein